MGGGGEGAGRGGREAVGWGGWGGGASGWSLPGYDREYGEGYMRVMGVGRQ